MLRSLTLSPQPHLLEISISDMCSVAWSARNVGEEEGGKISGVKVVIVEASGISFLNGFVGRIVCRDWRSLEGGGYRGCSRVSLLDGVFFCRRMESVAD